MNFLKHWGPAMVILLLFFIQSHFHLPAKWFIFPVGALAFTAYLNYFSARKKWLDACDKYLKNYGERHPTDYRK